MEQSNTKLLLNLLRATMLFICVLILGACKKQIPNPETLDPIYADMIAQAAGIRGKAVSQKKKVEELDLQISKFEPRDPALKHTEREKENLVRGLIQIEQDAQYFEIRAEQRRLYDKEAYGKAFSADLDWPPPNEIADYKESKKLRSGSRNWDDKVPKATQYNKPVPEKKKKKEEKKAE